MPEQRTWPELLLEWMSERGSGGFADLSAALGWLFAQRRSSTARRDLQARSFLRALSDLGMAENTGSRWSVAPPVVTGLPRGGGSVGLLTGSRTPALSIKVDRAASQHHVDVRRVAASNSPSAILLHSEGAGSLEGFASELNAVHVRCAAEQLAALFAPPDVTQWPDVWEPERSADKLETFDTRSLQFSRIIAAPAAGLVEVTAYGRTRYLFGDGTSWRHVRRSVGVYLELARSGRKVVRWSAESGGTLSVPIAARLPALPARAATLCSGTLPGAVSDHLVYTNVPLGVASAVCRAVGQPRLVASEGQDARA